MQVLARIMKGDKMEIASLADLTERDSAHSLAVLEEKKLASRDTIGDEFLPINLPITLFLVEHSCPYMKVVLDDYQFDNPCSCTRNCRPRDIEIEKKFSQYFKISGNDTHFSWG